MRLWTLPISIVVALVSVSCGSDDGGAVQPVATTEVEMIAGQLYQPTAISIEAGEMVMFTNVSSESHSVTAYEDQLPSGAEYFASGGLASEVEARKDIAAGLLQEGETFEVTLSEPGNYDYFCVPHEGASMKGTIVVEE